MTLVGSFSPPFGVRLSGCCRGCRAHDPLVSKGDQPRLHLGLSLVEGEWLGRDIGHAAAFVEYAKGEGSRNQWGAGCERERERERESATVWISPLCLRLAWRLREMSASKSKAAVVSGRTVPLG